MANYDNWYNTSTGEKQTVPGSQNPSGPGTWTTKEPLTPINRSGGSSSKKKKQTVHIPPEPIAPVKPELYEPDFVEFNASLPYFTYDPQITVKKYEYFYGIKDISITCNEYDRSSVFVSKPIMVDGNILKVELYSEEEHPDPPKEIADTTKNITSIEYYVTNLKAPSVDQWIPILPQGQKIIYSEKLFIKNNEAKTRFLASLDPTDKITIKKNNIVLSENEYIVFNDVNNRTTVIKFVGNDQNYMYINNIYTIDYIPEMKIIDPYAITFDQSNSYIQDVIETFDGADINCSVELKHVPYIDKELIYSTENYNPNTSDYRPIEINLNGNFKTTEENIKEIKPYSSDNTPSTYNKTDYITMTVPDLDNYSTEYPTNLKFEYYHSGKRIYFTEPFKYDDSISNSRLFHGTGTISVKYSYIVPNILVKIILRNNDTAAVSNITPFLKNFILKISYSK